MNLLIFNCGSSSLACKVYRSQPGSTPEVIAWGKAHHLGLKSREAPYLTHWFQGRQARKEIERPDHRTAAGEILTALKEAGILPDAVGHRFVHGGTDFTETVRLTPENMPRLEACSRLAPMHNPNSLSVIELCNLRLKGLPQFAAFDTAFHATLPEASYRYALPLELADSLGLRKYGFHGLSYRFVSQEVAHFLGRPLDELRLIACHIGTGGASVAAIAHGRSLDTSMGLSPLAGLIMSTRCGDLDPTIPLTLIEEHGYTPQEVNRLLNKESGLLGISGFSSDLFEIVAQAEQGVQRARLALEMYTQRLKLYLGGYLALLGGCEALAFTDDIGQRCWQVRALACQNLGALGIDLDPDANRRADGRAVQMISASGSRVKVLVVPTDEELVIARDILRLLEA